MIHLLYDKERFLMPSSITQVLVFLLTPPVSAGRSGPACQKETQRGQRADIQPTEGEATGQPERAQLHRQQLQPERQNLMRPRTLTARPVPRNTERNNETHGEMDFVNKKEEPKEKKLEDYRES